MTYTEKRKDLFTCPEEYYLADCISADFNTQHGIVTEFNKRFALGNNLHHDHPGYLRKWHNQRMEYDCILCGRVINLVTKERYFQKPTNRTLRGALLCMKEQCQLKGIQKVAMPLIGCGLDQLKWHNVSRMIQEVFGDTFAKENAGNREVHDTYDGMDGEDD